MSTTPEKVVITAELTPEQAEAFAFFLKSVSVSEYLFTAVSREEGHLMRDAADVLRESLASAGFNPR